MIRTTIALSLCALVAFPAAGVAQRKKRKQTTKTKTATFPPKRWKKIDDEEPVRRLAGRALRQMGMRVHEAPNGLEALRIVETEDDVRIVVLDATMPGIRGDRVLEEIARRRPDLPVILSTGDPEGFAAIDPRASNAHWLPKPYRADALQAAVAGAVAPITGGLVVGLTVT